MNIQELDAFNLADAVKFHDHLNPRLWDQREHLRPEVHSKLMEIARDFQEFLGVDNIEVKDITISGSNAAYNYTPHSDVDLHLIVDMPQARESEVFRELFDAKKFQYNTEHDIRIGGYDVELYVQDSEQPHHSQGIYSLLQNRWLSVPKRRKPEVDDISVKSKYEDVGHRIEAAILSGDQSRMDDVWHKLKTMRSQGLEREGEFSPENIAFKMLRNNGTIGKLKQALQAVRDRELSLAEKAKPRQRVTYGFAESYKSYFKTPEKPVEPPKEKVFRNPKEYEWYKLQQDPKKQQTKESPDGVNPSTKMFLESDIEDVISKFFVKTTKFLDIQDPPKIVFHHDTDWSEGTGSFGQYDPDDNLLHLATSGRHTLDVLRTMAHELTHCKQNEKDRLPPNAGETGSWWEDEANAMAGRIMRYWAEEHPDMFGEVPLEESSGYIPTKREKNDPRFKTALTVDVQPGETGRQANKMALNTDAQGRPALLMKSANLREGRMPQPSQGQGRYRDLNEPLGPETPPTMPAGTVKVDVSDVYDWYKLGQHISNLKGLGKHDFGAGPPSAIISFGDEDLEHQYIDALKKTGLTTTDIDPASHEKLPGQKTDPTYNVDESFDQPYPMTWERGEFGDWSASAQLPDGNYIEILFTRFNRAEQVWHVEFYRNHSQDITGEGDAQRVFATVMQAIRKFANKIKPPVVKLAATKDVDPGVKPESRARLYQRMAQRFAADMGYQVQIQDRGVQVNFEFTRQAPVVEDAERNNDQLVDFRGLKIRFKAGDDWVLVDAFDATGGKRLGLAGFDVVGDRELEAQDLYVQPNVRGQGIAQAMYDYVKAQGYTIHRSYDQTDMGQAFWDKHRGEDNRVWEEDDLVESLRREFELLENEVLGEISMRPSSLRQEAAKTGALAGMEFEMIVPNVEGEELDPEYERDDSYDRRARSFDDIEQFFFDGDYNGRGDIRRLMERLREAYQEWMIERTDDDWTNEGEDYVRDYVTDNDLFDRDEALTQARDEIIDANPNLDTDSEEFNELLSTRVNDLEDQFAQDEFENQGSIYNDAYEQFVDGKNQDYDESDFLQDTVPYMSDVADSYDIQWPYWIDINAESSGDTDIDAIAADFSEAIGRPVNASQRYSAGEREPGKYVVEPDGSLDPDNSNETGLEFVSPPLPIDEILSDLNKVREWAGRVGAYTNSSTGLHINISVPNFDPAKLDYVKLALLLGDKYVLEQFGRSSNTYTESALGKVEKAVRENPQTARALLDKMRGHMGELATKAIHSGETKKYTSINTKSNRIEFRSPGGDWLDENFDKVENTLLRFTVALSAAMDPEAYREEYLKKLYKLLDPQGGESRGPTGRGGKETIRYFADYVAGNLPQAALRSFVKQAQLERQLKKGETGGQKFWWEVSNPRYSFGTIEVVASSEQEAIEKALGPDGYPSWANTRNTVTAKPLRPYEEKPQKQGTTVAGRPNNPDGYWYLKNADTDEIFYRFNAANYQDAHTVLQQWKQENPNSNVNAVYGQGRDEPAQPQAQEQVWYVSPRDNPGREVQVRATSELAALQAAAQMRPDIFGDVAGRSHLFRAALTGAGQASQQALRPLGAGRELVGWSVRLADGREVTQIHGIGNNQDDANRIAAEWLRNNDYGVSGEGYRTVPLWREA